MLYSIITNDGLNTDFIVVEARNENDAWNIFWDKIVNDPNIKQGDFGNKDDYDYRRGSWHRLHGIMSITIEECHMNNNGYKYIGGVHKWE